MLIQIKIGFKPEKALLWPPFGAGARRRFSGLDSEGFVPSRYICMYLCVRLWRGLTELWPKISRPRPILVGLFGSESVPIGGSTYLGVKTPMLVGLFGSESVRWVACAPGRSFRRKESENSLKRGTARGTEGVREAEECDSFREREGGLNAGVCSQFGPIRLRHES